MTIDTTPSPDAGARHVANQLNLRPGSDVDDLIAAIARLRHRPFHVHRMTVDLPPTRHGVWIATDTADRLVVTNVATPTCLLHDLAHVILGHNNTNTPAPQEITYTLAQETTATRLATYLAGKYPNLAGKT